MKYPQLVSMPSAVSDWLEEQLEARGIDAVIYARYILSLLHSDANDTGCLEDELNASFHKKEFKRSPEGRKRFRRSYDLWKNGYIDAEQLKRTAAVECLMSASEQSYDVEKLVDELCEKLKQIENDTSLPKKAPINTINIHDVSPQELAKQYYAAFPALNRNTPNPTSHPKIVTKWVSSPKKKIINKKQQSQQIIDRFNHYNRTQHDINNKNNHTRMIIKQKVNNRNNKKEMFNVRNSNRFYDKNPNMFNGKDWPNSKELFKIVHNLRFDDCFIDKTAPDECNQNEMHTYDDLPVDIVDLLDDDSSTNQKSVEMMNFANMRDTGNRDFIRSGTNITSSIWSNEQPKSNNKETRLLMEKLNEHECEWSLGLAYYYYGDELRSQLSVSYAKLNHSESTSPFVKLMPRIAPFHSSSTKSVTIPAPFMKDNLRRLEEKKLDDLLTSVRTHFRPINEKNTDCLNRNVEEYADGATFYIANSLDRVEYERSSSGSLLLEVDGVTKKYHEYKTYDETDDSYHVMNNRCGLIVKFNMLQNDIACQTDDEGDGPDGDDMAMAARDPATDKDLSTDINKKKNEDETPMWNCDWSANGLTYEMDDWTNAERLRDIWCGDADVESYVSNDHVKHVGLREDISMDGDQLLSDLSSIQKTYMEELPTMNKEDNCEIPLTKEGKRRRSFIALGSFDDENRADSWSFASRLEEDCLIQMSAMPTLRSVTL